MIETAINEVLLPEEKIYEYQMITEIISKIAEKDTLEIFLEHLTLGEDKNEENTSTWNENFLNDKELQVPSERGNHVIGIHEVEPEQVKGNPSPQSDIYSLGAALYNIWSEDNLFDEESVRRLIKNIKKGGFEPLRHLDNEMEAICYKCFKQKQEKRYLDAKEFVRDLKNYRDHEDIHVLHC